MDSGGTVGGTTYRGRDHIQTPADTSYTTAGNLHLDTHDTPVVHLLLANELLLLELPTTEVLLRIIIKIKSY